MLYLFVVLTVISPVDFSLFSEVRIDCVPKCSSFARWGQLVISCPGSTLTPCQSFSSQFARNNRCKKILNVLESSYHSQFTIFLCSFKNPCSIITTQKATSVLITLNLKPCVVLLLLNILLHTP